MPSAYKQTTPTLDPNLETGRLRTFLDDGSWPHPDDGQCSAKNMAKAGFYYKGVNDQVKCFVCQIKLEDWDPQKDNPWHKHDQSCLFGKLGLSEENLTVDQWMDVFCNQAINRLDSKIDQLMQLKSPPCPSAPRI